MPEDVAIGQTRAAGGIDFEQTQQLGAAVEPGTAHENQIGIDKWLFVEDVFRQEIHGHGGG
jgi:hypothetical protein